MLEQFLKMYDLDKGPSEWKTAMSTKELLKMTKDTALVFANLLAGLSIKENGETIIPREMVFFTPAKTKSLKVDSTKEWFQTVNL